VTIGIVDVARLAASGSGAAPVHDHVDLKLDQPGCEGGSLLDVIPEMPALDEDVLTLDVSPLA
jgi:hypothetical protein